ncbi:MAG: potassium channel protein, partial [Kiritimatiellae bacterium]|nr:potassium channel protein [Kiritimatiellia bacterium]
KLRLMKRPREGPNVMRRAVWISVLSMTVLVVGTVGYRILGGTNASVLDCLYMTVITVLTIGYGEIIDLSGNPAGRIFTMFIAFGGIAIITYALSTLTAFAAGGELRRAWERRKMERSIAGCTGHFIIAGWSRVALQIARELLATKRLFVVVDPAAEEHVRKLESEVPLFVVQGEAGEEDSLQKAGIERAAGVFAASDDDMVNILICMTARQLNPAVRIVAAVSEPRNEPKMRKAGADAVVSVVAIGGLRMASEMVRPTVVSFLDVMLRERGGTLRVEEVGVPAGLTGCRLSDLGVTGRREWLLVALRQGEQWVFNPADDTVLEPGAKLILMTTPEGRIGFEQKLATAAESPASDGIGSRSK